MGVNPKKCIVIPNGISDFANTSLTSKDAVSGKSLKLLYVGVLSDSKGLRYILDAIRKVQQKGISVSLYVAGKVSEIQKEIIERENRDLSLHILGRVSFETLIRYYKICDVGIIASLQEQSSYVAIEMAMFGLPIITTAVDGLDEMFEDGIDALKVKTCFSDIRGLEVDTTMMANKIIEIFNSPALRERLSCNVRDKFLTKFQLDRMVEQTVEIYNTIINTDFN
jgi:glycosyltransferase involved in cell wall biosynthesis